MEISKIHKLFLNSSGITTDTRSIENKSIFFALKGENFNGNKFASEALQKGASFVIIDEKEFKIDERTLLVENVLETLQALANFHRYFLNIPIISLTGSNGKTTTKELINAVLSKKFNTTATLGNLNNHIGVPLTLLSMDKNTEIGIVEMGANHQKEIEFLCNIAQPDFGYITNFGKAHLEGFGGIEGVIKGKSELYDYLRSNSKKVFVNEKDDLQKEKSKGIDKITLTSNIEFLSADPFVQLQYGNTIIHSNLIGAYNATNIIAAVTIGEYFKISNAEIVSAIENYTPTNNRSQIIEKENFQIILDAYNANPSSMKVALENFHLLKKENKTVILGDMFELGDSSLVEHQNIVDLAESLNFEKIIIVGEHFYKTKASKSLKYKDFEAFKTSFRPIPNSNLLIKGSRGMALERTLDLFD